LKTTLRATSNSILWQKSFPPSKLLVNFLIWYKLIAEDNIFLNYFFFSLPNFSFFLIFLFYVHGQWKPLNVTTMGGRGTDNINLTITISKSPTNIKYFILGTWGSLGQFNNIYQVITLSAIKLIHYILWRFKLTTFCLSSFIFTCVVAIIEQTQQKY
jgi:hypothetical protein